MTSIAKRRRSQIIKRKNILTQALIISHRDASLIPVFWELGISARGSIDDDSISSLSRRGLVKRELQILHEE